MTRTRSHTAFAEALEPRTLLSQSIQVSVQQQTIRSPGSDSGNSVALILTITGPSLDASSFGDGNFLCEGPNGFKAPAYFALSPTDPGPGHGYRVTEAVVGISTTKLTPANNGSFYLDPQPNQIRDRQLGYLLPTAPIHAFDVDIQYVYALT